MEPISRKAAKAAGLKYYFTGFACKRGHVDKRFVASFMCATCGRERASEAYRELDLQERKARYRDRRKYLNDWKSKNRDRVLALCKQHNRARKETKPDYFREHYAKNRERRKKQSSEWYHANAEYALERQKAYVATRPIELRRAIGRKSRSKRRAIEKQVFIETVDPRVVFDRDKGICGICREQVDPMSTWEIDHVMPISKGGLHSYANVQLAHRKCNRSKAAKIA